MKLGIDNPSGHKQSWQKPLMWGITLIIVGTLLLLHQFSVFGFEIELYFLPIIVGLFGIMKIVFYQTPKQFLKGGFLLFIAIWIQLNLDHVWGMTFRTSWPILLIGEGLYIIIKSHLKGIHPIQKDVVC